jgi:hypothetical protein
MGRDTTAALAAINALQWAASCAAAYVYQIAAGGTREGLADVITTALPGGPAGLALAAAATGVLAASYLGMPAVLLAHGKGGWRALAAGFVAGRLPFVGSWLVARSVGRGAEAASAGAVLYFVIWAPTLLQWNPVMR